MWKVLCDLVVLILALSDAGEGCCNRVRDGVMVFGRTLPHRIQHGQVLSLTLGSSSCVHSTEHSCKKTLLGSCAATTLWLLWSPTHVCSRISPLLSFVWCISPKFFVLKFITCSNIAHSGLNVLCTSMLQGLCNNDGSFPKQGRYRELDSSTQKILKHQVSVCCQTYTSHFVKHSEDSESQQQQHQQQLITMQFPFTYSLLFPFTTKSFFVDHTSMPKNPKCGGLA